MSRIGKMPVVIPAGVNVSIDGTTVTVKGPKGELSYTYAPQLTVEITDGALTVSRPNDEKENRALHGLTRTLIANMVEGVTNGFKKELEIQGVGYRAQKNGDELVLNLGYSHPVTFKDSADITIEVPNPNRIIINGIDKQKVGQFAAEIREVRPPEPYKGKGVRYVGEFVRRLAGKAGAKK